MSRKAENPSIWDEMSLRQTFEANNIKLLHVRTLYQWCLGDFLHSRSRTPLPKIKPMSAYRGENKSLPKSLEKLNLKTMSSEIVEIQKVESGTKLRIKLHDGKHIETVIISFQSHDTVCVSSQVGCARQCKFCATGTMGMRGQLTAGEIVEQYILASRVAGKVRNIVFMGMGEPLDNFNAVRGAIETLSKWFHIGKDRITVSTVGHARNLQRLAYELPDVRLAVSLHAPNKTLRKEIIPSEKRCSWEQLLSAIDFHINETGKSVTIQYTMIGNVNSDEKHAEELAQVVAKRNIKVNLIPYNPTDIGSENGFTMVTDEQIDRFCTILRREGVILSVRNSSARGRKINAACGQLVVKESTRLQKRCLLFSILMVYKFVYA